MTAQRKPQPKPVLVPLRQLRQALTQLAPFAAPDPLLSMINVIQWQCDGKTVTLTATDRYVLGRAKVSLGEQADVAPFEPFSMKLADVKRLLSIFRAERSKPEQAIELTPGPQWSVADATVTLRGEAETSAFAPYESIIKDALDRAKSTEPLAAVARGWNPTLVARFGIQREPCTPVVCWPAPPNKPQLVTVTDWFYGIIMPVRIEPDLGQLDMIETDLRRPAPAEAATEAPKPPRRTRAKAAA